MNDFLIFAARLQDRGVVELHLKLDTSDSNSRVMYVYDSFGLWLRTFNLDGTDPELQSVKDDMVYVGDGPTAETVQAAICEHPLLADDLREWFADYLLLQRSEGIDAADETPTDSSVESTMQYVRGLMRGIDALRERKNLSGEDS